MKRPYEEPEMRAKRYFVDTALATLSNVDLFPGGGEDGEQDLDNL